MIEIIPTVIPKSLSELSERVAEYREFSHTIHVDINDGIFTEHVSWPCGVGQIQELQVLADHRGTLPKAESVKYDVHLMVSDPRDLGLQFIRTGAQRIIAHIEAFDVTDSAHSAFAMWKDAGAREVGAAVLMATPLDRLEELLPSIDFVQFMSIAVIGAHGAKFDEHVIARVSEFHTNNPKIPVAVDGGVNEHNISALVRAGATRFCVGTAIFSDFNSADAYARLVRAATA